MKRHLLGLALGALVGSFVLVGDAQACHKKKVACAAPAPVCAPAPVVECAPAPVCVPVVETCAPAPKKSCFGGLGKLKGLGHGFKGFGHKKACAPAPACDVVYAAPAETVYAAPQQVLAAPQASAQN